MASQLEKNSMLSSPPQRGGGAALTPPAQNRKPLLVCLSHLRWDFVFQRPQHLMTRAARDFDVLFFEEPVDDSAGAPWLSLSRPPRGVGGARPPLQPASGGMVLHSYGVGIRLPPQAVAHRLGLHGRIVRLPRRARTHA